MTRSLCLCRKISKGWVSVQGPDVLMITMEGQYYSGWGEGPPRPQCLEQGSLHLTSRHKGKDHHSSLPPWAAGEPSIQQGLLPQDMPRNRAGDGRCVCYRSNQSFQVEKKAEGHPLSKYLHISEIILETFQMLLTSRPFPHHCRSPDILLWQGAFVFWEWDRSHSRRVQRWPAWWEEKILFCHSWAGCHWASHFLGLVSYPSQAGKSLYPLLHRLVRESNKITNI